MPFRLLPVRHLRRGKSNGSVRFKGAKRTALLRVGNVLLGVSYGSVWGSRRGSLRVRRGRFGGLEGSVWGAFRGVFSGGGDKNC